jgi:hypothetical protein
MNKIVREHYPISKLPEDLREGLDPNGMAVITVTPEAAGGRRQKSRALEIIEGYRAKHPPRYHNVQEVLDVVRKIRDGGPL